MSRSRTGVLPRTSPEGDGAADAEAWEQATRWVEEHRKLIVRQAERYAGYAPYDRQDYLQQAVLAAFHAWKDCVRSRQPERFTSYCFIRFRRECRDELAIRRDAPASLRPEDRPLDPSAGGSEGDRKSAGGEEAAEREALVWKALRWMTPRQQLAWLLALGHLGHGRADPKEIARTLKISRRAAAGLLARGQAQAEEGARREKQALDAAG
ncbi:MAG: sigma-70 family RNA polymerase sigma factor [Thermodesulfobacteriota bacterium]